MKTGPGTSVSRASSALSAVAARVAWLFSGAPLSSRRERVLRWLPTTATLAAIWFGSSLSPGELPPVASPEAGHLAEYAMLGGSAVIGIAGHVPAVRLPHLGATWFAGMLWAASDEFHQRFVPGRDPSMEDLRLDAIGLATGLVAGALAGRAARALR